jgi:hypothetical protein
MIRLFSDYARSHLFELSISGATLSACVGYLILLDASAPVWLNLVNLAASLLGGGLLGVVVYQLLWRLLLIHRRWRGRQITEGCRVRILRGVHKGKIVQVDEAWDSRGQARVSLGDEARRTVADVFMSYQVERMA